MVPRPRAAPRQQALHPCHRHVGRRLHFRRAALAAAHLQGEEAKMDSKKTVPFQRNQMQKIVDIMGLPTKERWPLLTSMTEYTQLVHPPTAHQPQRRQPPPPTRPLLQRPAPDRHRRQPPRKMVLQHHQPAHRRHGARRGDQPALEPRRGRVQAPRGPARVRPGPAHHGGRGAAAPLLQHGRPRQRQLLRGAQDGVPAPPRQPGR